MVDTESETNLLESLHMIIKMREELSRITVPKPLMMEIRDEILAIDENLGFLEEVLSRRNDSG